MCVPELDGAWDGSAMAAAGGICLGSGGGGVGNPRRRRRARGKRGERRQAERGEEAAAVAVGGGGMFLWAEEGEGVFLCVRATWTISLAGPTPNGEKQTEQGRNDL